MPQISFSNHGEIDHLAISTFGASVKDSASPIGYFGTGLKYAIAVLLRTGHEIEIWSGLRRITFEARPVKIRGQDFELVYMLQSGEEYPMGFTLELGKNWEVWMAYREIYCNMLDEGGMVSPHKLAPLEGETLVIVSGEEFALAHANRADFILSSDPLCVTPYGGVYSAPSSGGAIFYRGVRVHKMANQLFSYNITEAVKLTEDRTLADVYPDALKYPALMLLNSTLPEVINTVLNAPRSSYEFQLDYAWSASAETISQEFRKELAAQMDFRSAHINHTLAGLHRQITPEPPPTPYLPNKIEAAMLSKSLDFLRALGFPVTQEIVVVESLGHGVLGEAKNGKIVICRESFVRGTKTVAGTILEEHLHITRNLQDCSRPMQNYLIDQLMTSGEMLIGEPL